MERLGHEQRQAAGRPPGSLPRAPAQAGDGGRQRVRSASRGAAARWPRGRRSAPGSGSRRRSGGVPSARRRDPGGAEGSSAARPRAARLAPRATRGGGARTGSPPARRRRARGAGRGPGAPACDGAGRARPPRHGSETRLRPSSPNLATSADAASSATWPIRRRPKRRSLARISPSGVRSEAGSGAEERGLRARRHRDELVRLRGEGRHGRGEARRRCPPGADPRAAPPGPRRRARPAPARAPTAPRARRSGPPGARRRRRWLGRAGDRGAERARRSKAAASARSASLSSASPRRQPVRRSERHPAPDPERPSRGIGVEHRPVRPGLPAEDDRPRRPRAGGPAPPREVEEEMWSMEMKQSHSSDSGHWEDGAVG